MALSIDLSIQYCERRIFDRKHYMVINWLGKKDSYALGMLRKVG